MTTRDCVIGMDFGTDSVRTLVASAADGTVLGAAVVPYPRWAKGLYCEPVENRFRHHPQDYLETLETSVRDALRQAGPGAAARVRGISADTTGSTPVLADGSARSPRGSARTPMRCSSSGRTTPRWPRPSG